MNQITPYTNYTNSLDLAKAAAFSCICIASLASILWKKNKTEEKPLWKKNKTEVRKNKTEETEEKHSATLAKKGGVSRKAYRRWCREMVGRDWHTKPTKEVHIKEAKQALGDEVSVGCSDCDHWIQMKSEIYANHNEKCSTCPKLYLVFGALDATKTT